MSLSCFRACQLNILPGTAIGLRYDWFVGFDLYEGSCFNSQGMPNRPNTFAPVSSVQEGPFPYLLFAGFQVSFIPNYWPEVVADPSRDPDYNPAGSPPPELNFRFSNLYLAAGGLSHHFWGGMVASCLYSPFFLPETSVSGVMFLQMRDCTLHSGWINLGEPDGRVIPPVFQDGWPEEWQPYCGPAIPGSVMLFNNLFDRVNINLDVDTGPFWWGGPYASPTIDLRLTATNNTFRGGYLYLEPVNAAAGNWVFENNLFDKTVFAQDQYQSLDYDYNAYWPCEGTELSVGQVAHFLPTTTGDGYTDGVYDGAHELKLTAPPPYAVGPLGNFYQSASSSLINKGNTTADQVGLYHYTTQVGQTKEGGSIADIGVHYAATVSSSSKVPKDTDSDGIPDYVEDNGNGVWDEGTETRFDTAYTVTGVHDSLNTVYDDVDLDGDGLSGGAERVLETEPLGGNNPLAGVSLNIPSIVSGLVIIPLPIALSAGDVMFMAFTVNGEPAAARVRKVNGNWLAEWDTTLLVNGSYYVAVEVQANGQSTTLGCPGKLVTIQNAIWFPDAALTAGDELNINAQTIYANGIWTMDVYDDQGDLFTSLNGNVDADGFCIDSATGNPGVRVSILDGQGNQLPSEYYDIHVAAAAPAGRGGPGASSTTRRYVERKWGNYRPGKWVVAYQRLYDKDSDGHNDQHAIANMAVDAIYLNGIAGGGYNPYGNGAVMGTPPTQGNNPILQLRTEAAWGQFIYYIGTSQVNLDVRNLFYFGHCDPSVAAQVCFCKIVHGFKLRAGVGCPC